MNTTVHMMKMLGLFVMSLFEVGLCRLQIIYDINDVC